MHNKRVVYTYCITTQYILKLLLFGHPDHLFRRQNVKIASHSRLAIFFYLFKSMDFNCAKIFRPSWHLLKMFDFYVNYGII